MREWAHIVGLRPLFLEVEVRGRHARLGVNRGRMPVFGEMLEVLGGGLRGGLEGCFEEVGCQPG